MNKYLHVTKMTLMLGFVYRMHFFFTAVGNALYIMLIYFLWKAIYKNAEGTIHGMTFQQVFLYLACAASIFLLFRSYLEWMMSEDVISGRIIMNLLKPVDYQSMMLFSTSGFTIFNLITVTIPTFIVLGILLRNTFNFGINILFFLVAVFMAFLLSFIIDYIMGSFSFYTESIWGISIAKEAIVLFLSGALIPIRFFPGNMQVIMSCLPFQAIYNIPLSILTDSRLMVTDYISAIGLQCFWLVVLLFISRIFFKHALKMVTVNGG